MNKQSRRIQAKALVRKIKDHQKLDKSPLRTNKKVNNYFDLLLYRNNGTVKDNAETAKMFSHNFCSILGNMSGKVVVSHDDDETLSIRTMLNSSCYRQIFLNPDI